ncbi:MAG: CAP domain-containing protein [Gammaproteobacteria bacterium]|nr:CAP domain-containing protein [Gammaproteobacteria bacterium]
MVNGQSTKLSSNSFKTIFWVTLYLCVYPIFSFAEPVDDLDYLNQLRSSANLTPFDWNPQLALAAENHAKYLSANHQSGHKEQKGKPFYTGDWADNRSIASQYSNRMVSENITAKTGDINNYNPVDNLMTAIYHRFTFLDITKDEIGIGYQMDKLSAYVYVLGNKGLSQLCQQPPFKGAGEYYFNTCLDADKKIGKQAFEKQDQALKLANPDLIIWPANNSTNIMPVFFEESPDPLPSTSVSGYPVSIEFNSAKFPIPPKVKTFTLHEAKNNKAIEIIKILNEKNDQNQNLTAYQHALFPKNRLLWGKQYSAKVSYFDPNSQSEKTHSWAFTTQGFEYPTYTIKPRTFPLTVEANKTFILYFPPRHSNDVNAALSYQDKGAGMEVSYIDKNTLKVIMKKEGTAVIDFHQKKLTLHSKRI